MKIQAEFDLLLERADYTMDGLRSRLFETMDALTRGDTNAQQANTVVNLSEQILKSVGKEIEYKKYVHDVKYIEDFEDITMPTFKLGKDDEL